MPEQISGEKISIQIFRDDSCTEGFAAYLTPSLTRDGVAQILLNIEATFGACVEYPKDLNAKEVLIENIMHEVGHSLEEYFKLEFDEERIERIVESYRMKYWEQINTGSRCGSS